MAKLLNGFSIYFNNCEAKQFKHQFQHEISGIYLNPKFEI